MIEYPVLHVRGGTSTGLILWEKMVPRDLGLCEELLRHLMGVPLAGFHLGNRQTTGLGRGPATSNKAFIADIERTETGPQIVSTLAQLASDHAAIDWSVNCGNMSSALQMWALDSGLLETDGTPGVHEISIRNTNTGVITRSRMTRDSDGRFVEAEIPGVLGAYPAVDLFLQNPVGSKTGRLLPTGHPCDTIAGIAVSCVDVAVPKVIVAATDLGKTAQEPIVELEADAPFMAMLPSLGGGWAQDGAQAARW